MITATGFGVAEFLTAIGMVAAFIMLGLVRDQQNNANKKNEREA